MILNSQLVIGLSLQRDGAFIFSVHAYSSVLAIDGNDKSTRCLQPSSRQRQDQGKKD